MSSRVANQATGARDAMDIKDPSLGWMIGFMFCVSFIGLFALVPLRKVIFFKPFDQLLALYISLCIFEIDQKR